VIGPKRCGPTPWSVIASGTFDNPGGDEGEGLKAVVVLNLDLFMDGIEARRPPTQVQPTTRQEDPQKMSQESVRKLTGISGVATGAMAIVVAPLYFIYDGPPPSWNVLTRTLLSVVMLAVLLMFFAGLRQLISTADGHGRGSDGLVSIGYSAGITYVAVTLVSASMEAGVPLYAPDGTLDPTVDGPLAAGMVLIHGPIARILTIIVLVSFGLAASRSLELPKWVSKSAYIIAAANLMFIPSLYFGMNAANFYASNGWGSTATISSVLLYWTAAVGVAVLRRRRTPTPTAEGSAFTAAA
jgi:hypothetical protein